MVSPGGELAELADMASGMELRASGMRATILQRCCPGGGRRSSNERRTAGMARQKHGVGADAQKNQERETSGGEDATPWR
jgi:hypothetical protein